MTGPEERVELIRRELRFLQEEHSSLFHERDEAYVRGLQDALRVVDAELHRNVGGTLLEARMSIDALIAEARSRCRN